MIAFIYVCRLMETVTAVVNHQPKQQQPSPSLVGITELSVHRLMITAILVASKFHDDEFYNNTFYGKIGGITTAEINVLEIELLRLLQFNLVVTPGCYYTYVQYVESCVCTPGQVSVPAAVTSPQEHTPPHPTTPTSVTALMSTRHYQQQQTYSHQSQPMTPLMSHPHRPMSPGYSPPPHPLRLLQHPQTQGQHQQHVHMAYDVHRNCNVPNAPINNVRVIPPAVGTGAVAMVPCPPSYHHPSPGYYSVVTHNYSPANMLVNANGHSPCHSMQQQHRNPIHDVSADSVGSTAEYSEYPSVTLQPVKKRHFEETQPQPTGPHHVRTTGQAPNGAMTTAPSNGDLVGVGNGYGGQNVGAPLSYAQPHPHTHHHYTSHPLLAYSCPIPVGCGADSSRHTHPAYAPDTLSYY